MTRKATQNIELAVADGKVIGAVNGKAFTVRQLQLLWAQDGELHFSVSGRDEQDYPIQFPDVVLETARMTAKFKE